MCLQLIIMQQSEISTTQTYIEEPVIPPEDIRKRECELVQEARERFPAVDTGGNWEVGEGAFWAWGPVEGKEQTGGPWEMSLGR